MSTLVIVESPTKARTIRNFLPSTYQVEASMGHVRDLPKTASEIPANVKAEKWSNLGVNIESDFEPLYVVPKDKKKIVKELKDALAKADELLLATDEDREGESISWHLIQLLKPKVPIKRMVFHEITDEAIKDALQHCRTVDQRLVRAQETRRILDRLVGYTVSPLLWKKIAPNLSAGRVQSVAVRLLVKRERERLAFKQASYWDLKASLEQEKAKFTAKLITLAGQRLATGSDFDENTGQLIAGRQVVLLNETEAIGLQARLTDKPWQVSGIEERPVTRKPAPPFTTSTLQQESNRKLRLSARDTMRVAQSLYEQGYITYMRTDSVNLSQQAISAARSCVETLYGKDYLSPSPRQFSTKSKGAQEAHEAIRPAGSPFRTPKETGLSGMDLALYELIWKRTMATQMADARQTYITVQLAVEDAGFRASGKRIDFPGFFRAYVEGSDDPEAALDDQEIVLPNLTQGDRPSCKAIEAVSHETQPPARFTDASLVKMLESEGIGRPSTYATVIDTITRERGYAQRQGNTLVPSFTAFAVTALLEKHFPDLVDLGFTARMEQTLDDIATGEAEWLPYLKTFYLGDMGLETQVKDRETGIDSLEARTIDLGADLDAKIRIGKFGPYVEGMNGDDPVTASLPKDMTPGDVDSAQVQRIIKQKVEGPEKLGFHPETGEPIYILDGTYGPYVQLGDATPERKNPKRTSLPKGVKPEDVDLTMALNLLALPRLLGHHPETSAPIKVGLGRFGPYVVHDQGSKPGEKDFRSLKADDNLFTVELERALELLSAPKGGRGRRSSSKTPLKELGVHPYGHYVKHGKTNVGIPEGKTFETLSLEEAVALLETKSGSKKTKKTAKGSSAKTAKSSGAKAKSTKEKSTKAKSATAKSTATKAKSTTTKAKSTTTEAKSTTKRTTRSKASTSS
jgi:DNA topoisomerase I